MKKLHLIIAEASLELVPPQIASHPAVKKNAKKRGKKPTEVLLDVSLHHSAMKRLPNSHKRGRPDIIHRAMLSALDSPLNKEGKLRLYVHTINDLVIYVKPEVRLPRDYRRFIGLIEQLFKEGKVPREKPLLWIERLDLEELIQEIKPDVTILLSELGEITNPIELGDVISLFTYPAIIVGGFPHGDFSEKTLKITQRTYSIYKEPLETTTVISRLLCGIEFAEQKFKKSFEII